MQDTNNQSIRQEFSRDLFATPPPIKVVEKVEIEEKIVTKNSESFDNEIFDNLPQLLREPCNTLISKSDKEVFLVGALGVVSGILPNVKAIYNGKEVYSNLFCYVWANYGTGKGALSYAYHLGAKIHKQKKDITNEKKATYQRSLAEFEDLKKKKIITEQPIEPSQEILFIPANSTKTGMYELIGNNEGRGILFETEGDVLADTIKQDHSNFSDGLRQSFHHEKISYYRRGGKEFIEIEEPCLSVVISSTFDQLTKLIPTIENGLFSRFFFYHLEGTSNFIDVFDNSQNHFPDYFRNLGDRYLRLYNYLMALETPLIFDFSEIQKDKFMKEFTTIKLEIREYVNEDLNGTINRLGLICFRISMILSVLRAYDEGTILPKIICTDIDFETAFKITRISLKHAISIYYSMPKPKQMEFDNKDLNGSGQKANEILKAKELSKQGMNARQISIELYGNDSKKSTIHRWIN
jgi:Protein of unknown function (DUF3987)